MEPNELPLVTIFGASGFVGTQVVQALARKGYRIRAAVRRPDLAGHLRMPGAVGQIVPVQANVRNAASVLRAVQGAGIVINLVGIGIQRGAQQFDAVNVEGAKAVAEAARAVGAQVLVHVSGLGLLADSSSAFARSKAAGEEAVSAAFPQAIILRPSVIFGPGDGFFTRMGTFARMLPVVPLIGADARMQPVYVGDVADVIAKAAVGDVRNGRIYELGGPEIETNRELWQRVLRETGRSNPLLPVSQGLASLLAMPMGLLPKPPLTGDQVILLGQDNLVSEGATKDKRTLLGLGITPVSMDTILPTYLWRFRRNGQFERLPA
ncbi:NAD-dependent epimerase/dehydratase [Devosia sp. DBB001]|nr:NAD-dependent epimerase/dehydratase [Devosia sp. DBB001]